MFPTIFFLFHLIFTRVLIDSGHVLAFYLLHYFNSEREIYQTRRLIKEIALAEISILDEPIMQNVAEIREITR